MYEDTEKFVDQTFEQSVRVEAYHLWEAAGRPEGREHDFWFFALENMLAKRDSEAADVSANAIDDHSRLSPNRSATDA